MTAPLKPERQSAGRIFAWPAVLALASAAGLLSALVGDGLYDALSWLLLGGPVVLILRQLYR